MKFAIVFVIAFVAMMIIQVLSRRIQYAYVNQLIDLQIKDPKALLVKLNNLVCKFIVPKYQRYSLAIDANINLKDSDALQAVFEEIHTYANQKVSRLLPNQLAMLLQKEFSYYIYTQDNQKAEQANKLIQSLKISNADEFTKHLQQECNTCLQVYVKNNYAYIDKLKESIDNETNKIVKGISAYRLAHLYLSKGNIELVKENLEIAKDVLQDNDLSLTIDKAINDNSLLNKVVL